MKPPLSAFVLFVLSSLVFADQHGSSATTVNDPKAAPTQTDSFKSVPVSGQLGVCGAASDCVSYVDIKGDLAFSELSYTFLGEGRNSYGQYIQPIRIEYVASDNMLKLQIGRQEWIFTNLARAEYADHEYDFPSKSVRLFVEKDKYLDGNNVTKLAAGSYLIMKRP
jgi:hypothetical protein